ncbi:uridine kinase family protein [Ornithinicoccus halotolerans]|uniref:uridine kinase family protein n=1 Tax=Ornithinicoccus halotolerans TaxID=1748220 RepID=UPI001E291EB7|nr:ATP-binding protein [Ornithinicoccus halotolerans]
MPPPPAPAATARVLVLCGPSGAGKSRLAERLHRRYGWPVMQLDDFYLPAGDPGLPMSPWGVPDWDDAASWDLAAAVEALGTLCRTGVARIPVYDIARSAVTGHHTLRLDGSDTVVAEGIFAAHTIGPLRERGMLLAGWCIRNRPWLTFGRRLARDLAERRKPPLTLWRRGHTLRRTEPAIVQGQLALGAEPMTAQQAEQRCRSLVGPAREGTR